ncbi:hypothetical protein WME79_12525 [Sorangium sp. So ce726]|uniref:hypothetical protein n=1 Tax=Sorangium sp. So ce726 TaxID=3133319 RepID=UPI003F632BE9
MSNDDDDDGLARRLDVANRFAETQWSLELLGTVNWDPGPPYVPHARARELSRLPALRASLRKQGRPGTDAFNSVALVDWTSLDNSCRLLSGDDVADPFVALLDLATVTNALIFYDRVVVLDDGGETAARANKLMWLDDVIRPLDMYSGAERAEGRWQRILDALFASALAEIINTGSYHPNWLDDLAKLWQQLVPSMDTLDYREIDTRLSYSCSPQRHSGSRMIFDYNRIRYLPRSTERLHDMILDNDVRALFYERLAHLLSVVFWPEHEGPPVRYVGGCLRTPMRIARERAAAEMLMPSPLLEQWLQERWAQAYQKREIPVQMPFWFDALMARTENRSDLPEAINSLRAEAAYVRRRRADTERALARGDASETTPLVSALLGDINDFSKRSGSVRGAALDLGQGIIRTALPVVPMNEARLAFEAASKLGPNWLDRISLRLFRPQLWSVFTLGQSARQVQRSIDVAFALFSLPAGNAKLPRQFLSTFATLPWVV